MRVGVGWDVHAFGASRGPVVLGGVRVEHHRGLTGHSDADVLAHAVCDALLGAAALGDIGAHFPDDDPAYRGISSIELLRRVGEKVAAAGWSVGNVDATVICERPRVAPHREAMGERLASALSLDATAVSVKASSSEGLGALGREEGIAAIAVALLVRAPEAG